MKVYYHWEEIERQNFDQAVVTLGTFDGVHLGHQKVIQEMIEKKHQREKPGMVITYEPHPQSVVAPRTAPKLLTTLEEKLFFLKELKVDHVLVLKFDKKFSEYKAQEFIEMILVKKLKVGDVVVGYDHAFGKDRAGGEGLLQKASQKFGFGLEVVSPVEYKGMRLSSTRIREKLKQGDFDQAIEMLGHSYPISGEVVEGKKRGKELGYPTINLNILGRKLFPPDGVYSAQVRIREKDLYGMVYLGENLTFQEETKSLEVHIFDWNQKLAESRILIFLLSWIREKIKFPTPESLKWQLKEDEKKIKALFNLN